MLIYIVMELDFFLQDNLFEKEVGLTEDLTKILTELTQLSKAENAKVALKARQVRIVANITQSQASPFSITTTTLTANYILHLSSI